MAASFSRSLHCFWQGRVGPTHRRTGVSGDLMILEERGRGTPSGARSLTRPFLVRLTLRYGISISGTAASATTKWRLTVALPDFHAIHPNVPPLFPLAPPTPISTAVAPADASSFRP